LKLKSQEYLTEVLSLDAEIRHVAYLPFIWSRDCIVNFGRWRRFKLRERIYEKDTFETKGPLLLHLTHFKLYQHKHETMHRSNIKMHPHYNKHPIHKVDMSLTVHRY